MTSQAFLAGVIQKKFKTFNEAEYSKRNKVLEDYSKTKRF